MKEHTSKMMGAVPLQASKSCTTILATKLEKRMLNAVQRQKDDNGSAGIPEIYHTTAGGHTVKMQEQCMKTWFPPLQKFSYPGETLLPLEFRQT